MATTERSKLQDELTRMISKVYPDFEAYGVLIDSVDEFNNIIPKIASGGYCKLAGSFSDGSFNIASRSSSFDVDFTWILNGHSFENPNIQYVPGKGNYVIFVYEPFNQEYAAYGEFTVNTQLPSGKHVKAISPEMVKKSHPTYIEHIMNRILGNAKPCKVYKILASLLEKTSNHWKTSNVFNAAWYNVVRNVVTLDITPVLKCSGSPILQNFMNRQKKAPFSKRFLEQLKEKDFYLVPKSMQKELGSDSHPWRLSFAECEEAIFRYVGPFARRAYAVFKLVAKNIDIMYIRADLLSTYHLKNVFFWSFEENRSIWQDGTTVGVPVYYMFEKLLTYVEEKRIPFYFEENVSIMESIGYGDQTAICQNIRDFLKQPMLRPKVPFPFPDSAMVATEDPVPILQKFPAHVAYLFCNSLIELLVFIHNSEEKELNVDTKDISNAFIIKMHNYLEEWNECSFISDEYRKFSADDYKDILKGVPGDPPVVQQIPRRYIDAFCDALSVAISAIKLKDDPAVAAYEISKKVAVTKICQDVADFAGDVGDTANELLGEMSKEGAAKQIGQEVADLASGVNVTTNEILDNAEGIMQNVRNKMEDKKVNEVVEEVIENPEDFFTDIFQW